MPQLSIINTSIINDGCGEVVLLLPMAMVWIAYNGVVPGVLSRLLSS